MSNELVSILQRAADKAGVDRVRYEDHRVPNTTAGVCILPFFGDMRSTCVMSAFLLRRFREETKGSKYFIVLGWPGLEGLFPYVDEYWSVKPETMRQTYGGARGFINRAEPLLAVVRNLNTFFEDVVYPDEFEKLYHDGFQQTYLDKYKNFKRFFPAVPSSAYLGGDFMREMGRKVGEKVFLFPSRFFENWNKNEVILDKTPAEFWGHAVERLCDDGYVPIVVKSPICHEISGSRHITLDTSDVKAWLAAMRVCGVALDFFNGISRLCMLARCPFVSWDQRARYNQKKEYEFEDLSGWNVLPGEHIYSFPTLLNDGDSKSWNQNILDLAVKKIRAIMTSENQSVLPSTGESYEVIPYATVRNRKVKKFGTQFIRVPKI